MRGEVLDIDADGEGIISGDDSRRYSFRTSEVARFIIQVGDRIDFVPDEDRATEIMLLSAAPSAFAPTYSYSRRVEPDAGSPWRYFLRCMSKYATGEGRAAPREYWWFVFFRVVILLGLFVPVLAAAAIGAESDAGSLTAFLFVCLAGLFWLATLLPDLVAKVRRLHDTGVTGFALLLYIVPFGSLIVLVMLILPSSPHANQYGPVPPLPASDRGDGRWD